MSRYYDKNHLKEQLELEQIYDLLELWGGEPEYNQGGLVSQTICHNLPGQGSRKLYYYEQSRLFVCYTNCGTFDIFDLCIKVKNIQEHLDWELYDAMDFIAGYFGLDGIEIKDESNQELEDWNIFKRHSFIREIQRPKIQLKEYDPIILQRFSYPKISNWIKEGITDCICKENLIGYYPGGSQITIPHFDINNRLVGIRGRSLVEDEANRYGKYRPLKVSGILYNHPLSMNLYNLNNSKENIKRAKTAIIFESEKSSLKMRSYYDAKDDISVAVCGSSLSSYQVSLLMDLGVREIIIAFDRQFVEIGDNEFKRLKAKLIHINDRYGKLIKVTAIFDKDMLLPYKDSPIDQNPQIFEKLLSERFVPQEV